MPPTATDAAAADNFAPNTKGAGLTPQHLDLAPEPIRDCIIARVSGVFQACAYRSPPSSFHETVPPDLRPSNSNDDDQLATAQTVQMAK